MQSIVGVVIAYFVAISLYLMVVHVSNIPQGELWDEGFKVAFQFVAITALVIGFLIPTFQKEWDSGLRTFSLFTATMLVGYTVFRVAGLNPDLPLDWVLKTAVEPLLRWISTLRS